MNTSTQLPQQTATAGTLAPSVLQVAYTPDSDDAFNYYAWEHGHVGLQGRDARFHRDHIIALNQAAMCEQFDVVGVSSAAFPLVSEQYWILAVGNSVGRGYGPVLVSRHYRSCDELARKRIAVAGTATTGGALVAMYCPGAELVEMRYDRIADAVATGEYDAGVMIHEELLFFPEKGLHKVCDLGATWCEDTELPLPVGLNIVRKQLGHELARQTAAVCRASLQWGLEHFDQAFAFASRFGRGCSQQHISMFSNDDTLCLQPDVRKALGLMFDRAAAIGVAPRVRDWEVVDA